MSLHNVNPPNSTQVRSSTRQQKLTAPGVEWQVDLKQKAFRRAVATWKHHRSQIESMVSSGNLSDIKTEVKALRIAWAAVRHVLLQLDNLDPDDSRDSFVRDLEDETYRLSSVWLNRDNGPTNSVVSDSQSHCSGSSRSSRSNRKLDAVAKAAKLRTKLKYVELEAAKRAELSKLEAARDLEMAEAELEAIEREEGECTDSADHVTHVKRMYSPKVPHKVADHIVNNNDVRVEAIDRMEGDCICSNNFDASVEQSVTPKLASLVEQLRISRLPIPEPELSGGDYLKYCGWKSSFQALIGQQSIPDTEKMYYLKKYVVGAARECIEGCFLFNTNSSFVEAFTILDERFGDDYSVASAFRDKLDSWP